ncbi:amidohydrolase family protein [Glaciimonas sp. Gout2]|uniref:amidohydrolase family protein n=1 Tax=unclassified Glaciimonas TaxID=2644401 RepID=UPI002B221DBD|nr:MULTISPECIES: amidohydrolase family protein [unclassified Glaciimonas]MEB0012947.1 amidohydrolase family protein [Glaciimonas sp. Cout2]MEB0082903.1 amidohydrolase family protein [Glaciimonas sp. Gout2]
MHQMRTCACMVASHSHAGHQASSGTPARAQPGRHQHSAPETILAAGRGKSPTIDVHCHVMVPQVELILDIEAPVEKQAAAMALLEGQGRPSTEYNQRMFRELEPKMTLPEVRLKDMDSMGVDVQILSPSPTQYYYWAAPSLAEKIVRMQNETVANLCRLHPERFAGLGTVSLQHPELAVAQLEYAMRVLGLKGVEISTQVNGLELSDPAFECFWAAAERLGAVVFLHPLGCSLGQRIGHFYLSNMIGQPVETATALALLMFSGVMDRYPDLKLLAAHGGGFLPFYAGRFDHGYKVRPEAQGMKYSPSDYLRRIHYDSLVYEPAALRYLIDKVGLERIVIGTDYPFDMGHYDVSPYVMAVPGLDEAEQKAILGGNAARLFGLLA